MNTNAKKRNLILMLVALASIFVLLYSGIRFGIYTYETYNATVTNEKLKAYVGEAHLSLTEDEATGKISTRMDIGDDSFEGHIIDKYARLYAMNSDIAGWISIEDTCIEYPVMYTPKEEEYYLHRDFYKEESRAGLPFVDYRCNILQPSQNIIIYGHNMKDGTMFADLLKYENPEYYEQHRYIRFDTLYQESIYEIIAVFRTRVSFKDENVFKFYNFIDAIDEKEFAEYVANIKALSLYDIDARAVCNDELITLSTCEYSIEDGRFVVVARRVHVDN